MTAIIDPTDAGGKGNLSVLPPVVRADRKQIEAAFTLLFGTRITELRAVETTTATFRSPHTESGYFNNKKDIADAAMSIDHAPSIYVVLNEVDPALFARAANRVKSQGMKGTTTSDTHIIRRRWLPLDFDPVRPSGISSSDSEHTAAIERAKGARVWLLDTFGIYSILADSGNGAHLLIPIDEPNECPLVALCIKAVKARFEDALIVVDITVHNAARIWKLYGTVARKGDSTNDRPHRLSRILDIPNDLSPTPTQKLEALAALAPKEEAATPTTPTPRNNNRTTTTGREWLPQWLASANIPGLSNEQPWPEGGAGARKWTINPCPFNADHRNASAFITQNGAGAIGARCHHNGCKTIGWGWSQLREMFEPAHKDRRQSAPARQEPPEYYEEQTTARPRAGGHDAPQAPVDVEEWGESVGRTAAPPRADVVCMADVEEEQVIYLSRGFRIALGKLSLLAGVPGEGKSMVSMDFTSRVSAGHPWPDAPNEPQEAGDVIMLLAEDSLGDTVIKRLKAAGADTKRIFAIKAVKHQVEGSETKRAFNLAHDIETLRAEIQSRPQTKLVLIDTINSYIGGRANSDKDNEVRQILLPLVDMAEETGVAVLAISHLNKGGTGRAITRVMGSMAFVGVARMAWMLTTDEADKDRRILAPLKCNIGASPKARAFRIEGEEESPRIVWELEGLDVSADDMLNRHEDAKEERKSDKAVEWLEDHLNECPQPANACIESYKEAGMSFYGITEAKRKLNVKCGKLKGSFRGPSYWALPKHLDGDGMISLDPVDYGRSPSAVISKSTLNDLNPRTSGREDLNLAGFRSPPVDNGQSTLGYQPKSTAQPDSSVIVEDEL